MCWPSGLGDDRLAYTRLMPGDPVQAYLNKFSTGSGGTVPRGRGNTLPVFSEAFGLNVPLWDQYWHFWDGILHGNMGVSIYDFPTPVVHLIKDALPYTLALLVPAITLSYIIGNRLGRWPLGANPSTIRSCPLATSSRLPVPLVGAGHGVLPGRLRRTGSRSKGVTRRPSCPGQLDFVWSARPALVPAFPHYLPGELRRLGHRHAQPGHLRARNGLRQVHAFARGFRTIGAQVRLPQCRPPAALGVGPRPRRRRRGEHRHRDRLPVPGLGHLIYEAITYQDYFLLQGIFLFIILGVCIANFVIDIVYVFVDPG